MNSSDETAAKIDVGSAGDAAGSDPKLDEHVSLENLMRIMNQKRPTENLQDLLLRISHHLDYATSERKTIYYRLQAIDGQTKKIMERQKKGRASRFARYLVAICIGAVGVLAWQSYGEAAKQTIATKAPELGWSPEAKQTIASWVDQLGWTKPPAGIEAAAARPTTPETPQAAPATQAAADTLAPNAPATPSLDPEQLQQLAQSLAELRQSVEQIAAGQDEMANEIKPMAASVEMLLKPPTPPSPPAVAPKRKPVPLAPSSSRMPMPSR